MAPKKKPTPHTATERVADHRARIIADGGKQVAIMLSAESADKLAALCAKNGWTQTETINRLLARCKP